MVYKLKALMRNIFVRFVRSFRSFVYRIKPALAILYGRLFHSLHSYVLSYCVYDYKGTCIKGKTHKYVHTFATHRIHWPEKSSTSLFVSCVFLHFFCLHSFSVVLLKTLNDFFYNDAGPAGAVVVVVDIVGVYVAGAISFLYSYLTDYLLAAVACIFTLK